MFRPTSQVVGTPLRVLLEMVPASTRTIATRRAYSSQMNRPLKKLWQQRLETLQTPLRRIAHNGTSRPTFPATRSTLRAAPRRGFRSSARRGASQESAKAGSDEPQSLSARLRKLSREYGWAAVGVYLGLSVLDFPFCFLLVRTVGTERIGKIEHAIVSTVSTIVPEQVRAKASEWWQSLKSTEEQELGNGDITDAAEMAGWGVQKAQARASEEASLATQLALAYAIHKSFIFVRVPITAAITPRVVKTLRSWGWNIGKRATKP